MHEKIKYQFVIVFLKCFCGFRVVLTIAQLFFVIQPTLYLLRMLGKIKWPPRIDTQYVRFVLIPTGLEYGAKLLVGCAVSLICTRLTLAMALVVDITNRVVRI